MGTNADRRFRYRAAAGWLPGKNTAKQNAKHSVILAFNKNFVICFIQQALYNLFTFYVVPYNARLLEHIPTKMLFKNAIFCYAC